MTTMTRTDVRDYAADLVTDSSYDDVLEMHLKMLTRDELWMLNEELRSYRQDDEAVRRVLVLVDDEIGRSYH